MYFFHKNDDIYIFCINLTLHYFDLLIFIEQIVLIACVIVKISKIIRMSNRMARYMRDEIKIIQITSE